MIYQRGEPKKWSWLMLLKLFILCHLTVIYYKILYIRDLKERYIRCSLDKYQPPIYTCYHESRCIEPEKFY
jgi:hypothetical protein